VLGLGAGIYFLVTRTTKGSKKKKSKSKSANDPPIATLSFLVKTKNPDEEGTSFDVDFEGTPSASEIRTTIEDDVLTPWLDSEFLNEGFKVYYKKAQGGSFAMSNSTPFKTLQAATKVVVVISSDRMLPEPENEPELPSPQKSASKKQAARTGGSHSLLPTGDDEDDDEDDD